MDLYNLSDIKTIKSILNNYGFKFSKSLGQNFIISDTVCPKMAKECVTDGENKNVGVIEIGPGIGVLTVELAKKFKKVVSIEIDKNLIPILSETTKELENIKIINADVLKTDLKKVISEEFMGFDEINICANLPYYITSEILMYILESGLNINSIVVMVQKEAATRICASPGTRDSGAISLAVKYYGNPKVVFNVGRGCFIPSPNVDSAVIKIEMDKTNSKNIINKDMYFRVIKAAYGKRRKNILNSLSMGMNIPKQEIEKALLNLKISNSKRAEELSFDDFVNISNVLYQSLSQKIRV